MIQVSAQSAQTQLYRASMRKKWGLIVLFCLLAMLTCVTALNSGASGLSLTEAVAALFGRGEDNAVMIVRSLRLPRLVAGIVAGAGLALAGCIMQNNLRNPLASPATLGVSNAAAFGANVAIILLGGGSVINTGLGEVVIHSPYIVTLSALVCSLTAVVFIMALATIRRFAPEGIILAGVALSSLFSAGAIIIQYFSGDNIKIAAVVFWTFGNLGRASWREITIMGGVTTLCLLYFLWRRWDYNALDSGDETAKSLGVKTERVRLGGMFASAVIAAITVSFLGIIGFIGLVAPQIAKRLIGNDKRFLIPASALVGIIVLLASDTLARQLFSPRILPVGAVTSFLGAPLFLYLLLRKEAGKQS